MQDGRQFSLQPVAASLEQPNVAVITHSLDGTITGWSPAAERMFGYVTADIVGRSISVLMPSDRIDEERAIVQLLRRAQPVEPHQSLRTRKNGQLFPVAITFSLVRDADEVTGVTQSVRDLSWRHESEAVAEREQFANLLLESLPGIVYLYTEDGRFLRWSRSFEVATGYSAAEISSHLRPTDLFEPDYKQLVASRIGEVLRIGVSRVEAPLLSKDGKTTHYHFTGRRVAFHGLTCIVGMGIDISERVRAYEALRKSEERYRTTLESILEGCQLLDFCYRYLYMNDIAAVHNRRPNSELLGRTMLECWPGIEGSQVFRMLKRCMEQRVGDSQEIEFVFPDGSSGWFDVRAQPVPEGLFVLSIDISDRKRAETALRDMNENLERKVIERTSDLKAARERAESADRLKSAFLATMSHELRTPLNSILGFTGILLDGLPGPMNPEQQKQLGMVQNSARHLLALINDVLDVSKIEAGQLELRRNKYDLQSSLERVAVSMKPLAESKGLTLRVEISPETPLLFSDKRRVEQIVLNLLNNAIKFTEDGSITLSAAPGPDGSDVRLRVTDTGLGIKPEDMQTLFQPFRQIDAGLERQHEGTGLGLAICRRLTELLGGTIRVESTWGEGSTFEVLLPLQSEGG
ncbi:MAG TPA: PAS domain S-box protein [Polyangiales bacterium]|nr:PAS domain S-box protein [Polyangiales bacterium]